MPRFAIIDIGSNTSTLAVYEGSTQYGVNRIYQHGETLRLIRQIRPDRSFSPAAMDRTVDTIRIFAQRATSLGAEHIEAVATSAVRDASNQEELLARIRDEAGVAVSILDGEHEGVAAVISSVNTLPIQDGFVVDMGGGSVQIAHVVTRRARQVVSLPLGALRLTDRFFTNDPPSSEAVTLFRRHVQELIAPLGWFNATGGTLVGVGGSLRTLGKIDRRDRLLHAPSHVSHGHGYKLSLDSVETIWERVSRVTADTRRDIPGLAAHRVDTISAGALFFFLLMRAGGFDQLRVSAFGIREGMALRWLAARAGDDSAALVPDVRKGGLWSRFPPQDPARCAAACRRAQVLADAMRVEEGRHALLAATHVAASGMRIEAGVATLLDAPLPGFWNEDVLDVVDILDAGVPRHMAAIRRDRLRSLLDIALVDGELGDVRMGDDGLRISGGALSPALAGRFAQAWGRRIVE
jgi:exopolyphosphatase/pppGpp-phosphohydrolase